MGDMYGILIFVGIISLIGVILFFSWLAEKKRREQMALIAEELGLEYHPDAPGFVKGKLASFHIFNTAGHESCPS